MDDPVAFRFPASVRHRYERLHRVPAGLLVTGDALCSFNPIYGQGMSVAALEALTLRRRLAAGVEPQPRRWFRDLARVVDVPWQMSAGGDLAFPGVQGHRTRKVRLMGAYLTRLHTAAAEDAHLAAAFVRVAGWCRPRSRYCVPASPSRTRGCRFGRDRPLRPPARRRSRTARTPDDGPDRHRRVASGDGTGPGDGTSPSTCLTPR